MTNRLKPGQLDPTSLASVVFHSGQKGEDEPVLTLLAEGADPNVVDHFGFTALHRATQFNRPHVVRALLEAGADVNAATGPNKRGIETGKTALMTAAMRGYLEVAAILLEAGASMELCNSSGYSALILAAWNQKHAMVRLLREAGANVGLVEASLIGEEALVRDFLATRVDVDRQELTNALRWAAIGDHTGVIGFLLDSGASIDTPDDNGKTALMHAATERRNTAVRLLLECGADPNATTPGGSTALMDSVSSHSEHSCETVELLLAHGARADIQSRSGWTPLMLASLWGNAEIVELLLQHGANPNLFTDAEFMEREEGCSATNALMMAVGNGHIEAVRLLLAYGADPLAENNAGHSALYTANKGIGRAYKQAEIQQILPLLEAALSHT